MKSLKCTSILVLILFSIFNSFSQSPQVDGRWSDPIPFDIVPVAIANLPDGRIMTWSSKSKLSFGGGNGFTYTQLFDPSIGLDGEVLPETLTNTNHDMFCPGINNLADGRVMATGGSSNGKATIYNPRTETWEATDNMTYGRGYQGAVTLSDGSALVLGGSWSGGNGVKDAEIWTEELGWTVRSGIGKEVLWNAQDDIYETQSGSYRLDNHAWLWAAPNGKVFHAGPGETMHWIDVNDVNEAGEIVGSYTEAIVQGQTTGKRGDDIYSMNGTTVMFDVGKVLKFGGSYTYSQGTPSSDNAYVIDFNDDTNVVVTPTMNNAEEGRVFPSGVVLPNGEVVILGGMDTAVPFSDTGAHLSAEIFNPNTNTFRTVVDMEKPRTYHSAGILLNDGRVFMGGGGLCGNCGNRNHPDAEIYSPPYLFDTNGDLAVRPTLSAPDKAFYETSLPVVTSPDVTQFSFIRMSSATHSVNNEQRRVPVEFSGANGNYQLNIPNANIIPPGYYMLFAMNADGVPSVSQAVLVGDTNTVVLSENLIVSYDFFEGTGAVINDSSNNNNHGEIIQHDDNGNAVALSYDYWNEDGFIGKSLEMDGMGYISNSIVQIPSSPSFEALTNQISVMAWVNRNTGSIIPNGDSPNVAVFAHDFPALFFGYNNAKYQFKFETDAGAVVCEAGNYNPGEWEHIAGTYDGTEARLYVNGQEINSVEITGDLQINTGNGTNDLFTISGFYDSRTLPVVPYGNSSGITDELDGRMDNFKLYNTALTAQQIQDVYTSEVGNIELDLLNNLALNRPTSQSSQLPNGGESFRAVDGIISGIYNDGSVTQTATDDTISWWRVDLGDAYEYDLSTIRIYNRTDCCADRLDGATVHIGNIDSYDIADYTEVGNLTANSSQVLTQNLGFARYVMIRQTGVLSLAEVQVFGQTINCPAEGTPCDDGDSNTSNDIESGNCVCEGTIISCENLEIAYAVNGVTGEGGTEINVSVGDDVILSTNLNDLSFTVIDPNGEVLENNALNDMQLDQSGLYTFNSVIDTAPQLQADPMLYFASSEELVDTNSPATNALDGNSNTVWRSANTVSYPHEIQLDLGENSLVSGFQYLPSTASTQDGIITNYEIYVSNVASNWGTPVSSGIWDNTTDLKVVSFNPVQAKYLRFVALAGANGSAQASAAELNVIRPIPSVFFVDSEESAGPNNVGVNAIDGNPNTIWHTQYSDIDPDTPYPHEIQIDLGIESDVTGLEYLPRQSGINGTIKNYEIYISTDVSDWGVPVRSGTWVKNNLLKRVDFPRKTGRYVRLLALSEVNGRPWASAAEINVIRTIPTLCEKTIQINVDTVTMYTYDSNGWSPSNPNGLSNYNDDISVVEGEAEFATSTTVHNVTVNPGAALQVKNGVVLTAAETKLESTSQVYSSLIVDGAIEGVVKYERYVNSNTGGNDLISPPLSGQTFESFLASGSNADNILNDGNNDIRTYLFGPFDKTESSYVNYTDDVFTTLESGKGYRAGTVEGANLMFTGTVASGTINVDITVTGSSYSEWNLIGNPYPSYLDMELFLNYIIDDSTDPVITNLSILENTSGIYGYVGNSVSNIWSVVTLANASSALMTPGQGFFVAANDTYVADYDIVFDESMRAIGDNDDFILGRTGSDLTFLKLNMNTNDKAYVTEFYFNESSTIGLDLGYDGKFLGNSAPSFSIYSHLVEDNEGLPIMLQAFNSTDLVNTLVPLGVNANLGEQLTFSINENTLPADIEVYLEDTVANTVTLLNASNYILVPNTDLNGTGRFYLRFVSSTLSVNTNALDYLQIYTTRHSKLLVINGELQRMSLLNLYDVHGRLVFKKKLHEFERSHRIDISHIGAGVYIAEVLSGNQVKTQKILLH